VINRNYKVWFVLDIKHVSKLHTFCLSARVLEMYNAYPKLQFFARIGILDIVPESNPLNRLNLLRICSDNTQLFRRATYFSNAKWGFDFVHFLNWDFKFYGILAGAEIDKETDSINVDQIARKDDNTTILNLWKAWICWRNRNFWIEIWHYKMLICP
jgi:hypothetical protein